MKFKGILLLVVGLILNKSIAQNLIRNPQISPDASTIAFSYYGDIWVYNVNSKLSKRLTINKGYDSNPIWNLNGTKLAFASNRKGNTNVFTTTLQGGIPKQLTYYPTSNTPTDWTKAGDVVFTTKRVYAGPEWDQQIYEVNENGGTPERFLTAYGSDAVIAPNGLVAYVKGACRVAREDYSGSAQRDIWIFNPKTKNYIQITTSNKNDHNPAWDSNNNLYYLGAESGRYNIYKQKVSADGNTSGNPEQLTSLKVDGVRSFSVSKSGAIVYTSGIETFLLKDGKTTKLSIDVISDNLFAEESVSTMRNGANDFAISPNGKKIALNIAGEMFVKHNDKEKKHANNVTKDYHRDNGAGWLDDKTAIYLSDKDGSFQIYSVRSADDKVGLERSLKLEHNKLTKEKEDVAYFVVSPDRKKIAYGVGRGKLIVADIKDGKIENREVFIDSWTDASGLSWSPDSEYIAYSLEDLNFDSEIFIHSVKDKSKQMNVSMHPRSDTSPVWSQDGKKLAFLSNRSGLNYDVWMVWLQKEDWEKTKTDRDQGDYYIAEEPKKDKKEGKDAKKKDKKPAKKKITVTIDEDRLYERLVQVTSLSDNEYSMAFSADSKNIYFSATDPSTKRRNLYKVKWDGTAPKIVKGASGFFNLSFQNGKLYFTSRGVLKELNTKSDKITSLPHTAIVKKNVLKEREQIFDEGIRALTAGFYDPNFHGYDWKSLVKKYKPWVLAATTHEDYTYMFNLLLGQLNASHMGYRGFAPRNESEKIGLLGLEVKNVSNGVKVEYVLSNSVADKIKSKLNVGDVITSVNGTKIDSKTNFYSLLKNTINNEILLTLASGKEVVLRPQRTLNTLQYEEWIESRKKLVEKYSNGQLGYIHIRGMSMPSFERFERELKASGYGKKGIVIDVRYNGGGWTTDRLMAVLNVKQHAYTIPRGAAKSLKDHKKFTGNYPFNERAILSVNTKPVVALCNENSYSNAEIFSHAFKNLGLGKLVGQPTFGAVISTGGQSLQNGYIRMPFRAWFVKASGKNMENEAPAVPDYLIKNAPGWKERGEDAQLKKAVEVLLQDIN
ncbi:MdsD protein [Tenacibaculum sp. SZ-18]|uniref:S41 family peptidase n=1 Tax=Tenacibaculum sp. SZ-18 TaxID=754423 RepID=UPI000C2D5186|nr:S41 family peptidase [Tenacibaculum sp. SZ-18]AUC15996.1 MdsD protein [Tenacibaculum sp. SZ-18]